MLTVRSLRRVAGSCVRRAPSVRALSGESHSDFGAIKKDVPEGLEEVPKASANSITTTGTHYHPLTLNHYNYPRCMR